MSLYRTWLEIKKSLIKKNIKNIKKKISDKKLFLAVVKGNGWGYTSERKNKFADFIIV